MNYVTPGSACQLSAWQDEHTVVVQLEQRASKNDARVTLVDGLWALWPYGAWIQLGSGEDGYIWVPFGHWKITIFEYF